MACKNGGISIGRETSIGPNCIIHSVDKSKVHIGNCAAIAANCYIIGGPDYKSDRTDIPMIKQGFHEGKSISIGEDVWLGAGAYVLDGSRIGKGAIIGAKSMVKGNIPDFSVATGVPAVVKKTRGTKHE
jgi:acetyltransferase-like isoleucine patch superfamily enzyme